MKSYGNEGTYKCRVCELEDDKVLIDYPIHQKTGKSIFLINGTRLKVSFVLKDQTVLECVGRFFQCIRSMRDDHPMEGLFFI